MALKPNALLTLVEAEAWLRTGVSDNPALEEEINRVSSAIEMYCGRPLKEATYPAVRMAGNGSMTLRLKATPVKIDDLVGKPFTVSVNGVAQTLWLQESDGDPATKDVILRSTDHTTVKGLRNHLYRSQGWGPISRKSPDNILLTYTGGFATIPEDLKEAAALILLTFWRDRDKKLTDVTTLSGPFGSVSILDRMPQKARQILESYEAH